MSRQSKQVAQLLRDVVPGAVLTSMGLAIAVLGRVSITLLPAITSFITLMVASMSSRTILRRSLSRLHESKYFDFLTLALFSVPLILFLNLGYEYARMTIQQSLEFMTSLIVGLGVYLIAYPFLRLI